MFKVINRATKDALNEGVDQFLETNEISKSEIIVLAHKFKVSYKAAGSLIQIGYHLGRIHE